jgi:hypothetical protein
MYGCEHWTQVSGLEAVQSRQKVCVRVQIARGRLHSWVLHSWQARWDVGIGISGIISWSRWAIVTAVYLILLIVTSLYSGWTY